jgi:hypothetical protein
MINHLSRGGDRLLEVKTVLYFLHLIRDIISTRKSMSFRELFGFGRLNNTTNGHTFSFLFGF